ncbi:MAG: bifunctional phosphoribosylaminoimidazolecarboxamide formyltransferase/IMP cyclohydrolase [Clostridiales bacterium]|nr:bifunctional phosphoribosylaminoimidazolecarboxamide formyltransferase/IMP cyclohydrolase [Clostridiales bacterium]
MKKRAIISLFDKDGILDFAKALIELDYEILSTGGTAKLLSENNIPVTNVSDVTGFPECLDGRVKTLHPNIHGGILANRGIPEHMEQIKKLGVAPIDIVAVNLYPFKKTVLKPGVTREDAIENIDIGGPTMIRAAAKNWQDVAVIVDPADYTTVIEQLKTNGEVFKETKLMLAYKVFKMTSAYDALIASYLAGETGADIFPDSFTVTFDKVQDMRYGENPHQKAAFYKEIGTKFSGTLAEAKQLHGKEISYNNVGDADGAIAMIKEFGDERPCAVAVKHANPCGIGIADNIFDAYIKAYYSDPVSIFGGIIALNRPVDGKTAEEIAKIFTEIIIAPSFTKEAIDILTQKKNLRLLELPDIAKPDTKEMLVYKKVSGGLLVQEPDLSLWNDDEFEIVTDCKPTDAQLRDMIFGMKAVKYVKSNAILLAKDEATVGVGPGQTNRITALELAVKYAGEKAKGSIMASDAFFPFDDCVKFAAESGIAAIVQPGGSIRDADSIKAANEAGIPMAFTHERHFRH